MTAKTVSGDLVIKNHYIFGSLLTLIVSLFSCFAIAENPTGPTIVSTHIGIIGPSSADILEAAVSKAKKVNANAILIVLDTPGGLLTSTRQMVQTILNSEIPIIVWVGPKGARAASAGAFITMAADVAAMAPATNIGAAHPVTAGISADKPEAEDTAKTKILNDTIALAESIATARGRNIEMARSFVLASESITASDALEHNVIDVIASDEADLLKKINQRQIIRDGAQARTLVTEDVKILHLDRTLRQQVLEMISDPNVFYLLFLAGLIGLGFELTHPGSIFPGVFGAICLLLALIAMSMLPVNSGGLGLIVVGIVLLIAELFVPSFGALGIGGFIAFFLGSTLLFDKESGLSISIWTILPVMGGIALLGWFVALVTLRALKASVSTGSQGLTEWIGRSVTAHRDFVESNGYVRIDGELWKAVSRSTVPVRADDRLKVVAVNGLELTVEKLD